MSGTRNAVLAGDGELGVHGQACQSSVAVAEGVDLRNQEHHERGAAERQCQLIAKCEPAIERAADQFRCDELV